MAAPPVSWVHCFRLLCVLLGTAAVQIPTFYGLIKLLATCAGGSHVVAEALLRGGISNTLRNLIRTSSLFNASMVSPGNVLRSTEQLGDLVALAAHLLPPVPDAAAAMLEGVPPSPSFAGGHSCRECPCWVYWSGSPPGLGVLRAEFALVSLARAMKLNGLPELACR